MKNETRRKIANWLLKIPGFVEAFDQVEDIRIAKTISLLTKDGIGRAFPAQPSWLNGQRIEDWSKEEANIVIDYLLKVRNAKVKFEGEEIVVQFPQPVSAPAVEPQT